MLISNVTSYTIFKDKKIKIYFRYYGFYARMLNMYDQIFKRILILEDDFVNRQRLTAQLEGLYDFEFVTDGKSAIDLINESFDNNKFDLYVLDISVPGKNGLDVLQFIRSKEDQMNIARNDRVPVIMMTAYQQPFIDAFNQGCDDYILKPIEKDVLLRKIYLMLNDEI